METKFSINYKKAKKVDLDKSFDIEGLQTYLPIYSRFFDMDATNYNRVALNHSCHIRDISSVYNSQGEAIEKPIFVKFSPLLDPLNFLRGKYNLESPIVRSLPQLTSTPEQCMAKLLDTNNTSYVDGFFCYLTSMMKDTHGFKHGVEYYGSFLCIQKRFRYNIADDLDFVMNCPFFVNNVNKYFSLDESAASIVQNNSGDGSRVNKNKLCIKDDDEDNLLLDIEDLSCENQIADCENNAVEVEYEKQPINESSDSASGSASSDSASDSSCDSTSDSESDQSDSQSVWETESGSESDSESESGSDNSSIFEEEDEVMFSYLHNFPVQLIFQEKCAGTFDQLIMGRKLNDDQFMDALMQIVLMLTAYQKLFEFTHNDLHTNNVMYVETNEEFLEYKIDGFIYKVPTNGRIFKLIDFGRAIYKFGSKIFCSDSFSSAGDASTQYNCEPYFNDKKPRINPNPSFDLCRLGCSLHDFVCRGKEPKTPLQKLIDSWCNDDLGKSVLYKPSGQERYPDFKLYKMIARTVNNLVPKDQLKLPWAKKYVAETACTVSVMDIDALPIYA
jgi:hypothetical protein